MRTPLHLRSALAALAMTPALSGCLANAVVGVVTAPVRVAGKAVDLATTSQSESDENRGRALRRREARLGQLERDYARDSRRCDNGERAACDRREAQYDEMEQLRPTIPMDPRRRD